jgi:hypothetical protein
MKITRLETLRLGEFPNLDTGQSSLATIPSSAFDGAG